MKGSWLNNKGKRVSNYSQKQKQQSKKCYMLYDVVTKYQEGYIEELSTCFNVDTALLKSSENVLSET